MSMNGTPLPHLFLAEMLAVRGTVRRADGVQRVHEPLGIVLNKRNPELDLGVRAGRGGLDEPGGCA